jgi:gamma-glutamyltranspeptidase/glutathione hydrolase
LGDSDFAKVPVGLINKEYARQLAARIDKSKSIHVKSYGTPPAAKAKLFERHTTHICTADADGNWVAITATVNTTFGSKVIIPGLGVVMNNQMDDFSIAPGVPNAFGLIGAEANSVQAAKRPLSSMSPTIILKDGQPIMSVGAAGGPKIITQVLLAIIRHLDFEMPIDQAVGNPRWHHQWSPDRLYIEKGNADSTIAKLRSIGHNTVVISGAGVCQAITYDPKTKTFTGVHDPRVPGKAAGQK